MVAFDALCVAAAGLGGMVAFADDEPNEPALPPLLAALPSFALPAGAVELRNDEGCPIEGPWLPPCRTMTFGTNRDYQKTIEELKTTLRERGWSAGIELHDFSLHAIEPYYYMCVLYYDGTNEAPPSTATGTGAYQTRIEIVIDQCGVKY